MPQVETTPRASAALIVALGTAIIVATIVAVAAAALSLGWIAASIETGDAPRTDETR
jgi:hypothetical protein